MKRALAGLIVVAFASTAAATTLATRHGGPATGTEQERTGPDSARVMRFLDAVAAADPVVCELATDPIGDFWYNDHDFGIGQLADTRLPAREAKDSLSRRVTDPAAIRALSARLATDDPCVRRLIAKMLGNSAVSDEALTQLLGHESARVREAALRATGERERPQLRSRVERMLGASEAPVAAMAAWALGEFDLKASVPALRRALGHSSAAVRINAAHSLGELDDVSVAGDLERLVADDRDRRVRQVAIESLAELAQMRSLPVLARVLEGDDLGLSIAAAEAIGELDDLQAPPASLLRALDSPQVTLRRAALEALVRFEDESLAPRFLPHVTDADPEVRTMVIEALGELRSRSAIPALKRALNDPVAEVRRAAIDALAEIDDR